MARTHARVHLDLWDDEDYQRLTSGAQWLYEHLMSCRSLTFAGVADWRPERIALKAADLDADGVVARLVECQGGEFLIADARTEEVLIRSFVKHDGLLDSPNMARAMVRDYSRIQSLTLRAVLVGQLTRLRESQPDHRGWEQAAAVLDNRSITFRQGFRELSRKGWAVVAEPSGNPSETLPEGYGERARAGAGSLLPAPVSQTSSSSPKSTREAAVDNSPSVGVGLGEPR